MSEILGHANVQVTLQKRLFFSMGGIILQKSIQKVISLLLTAVLLISYVPAYGFADVVSEDSYAASDGETGETIAPEDAAVLSDNVEEVEDAVALFNAEQGESVEESYYPVITVQPEAEPESMEYSEFGGAFLEVAAEAAGNGELSYKWYRVSSPEDEQLSDDYAMDEMCLTPINILGINQFYCVVTNTVDGKDYSVKSDVVTIYVYKSYIAKLNLYKK